jgi:hypothetical protein
MRAFVVLWKRFWFKPDTGHTLGLFRIALGLLVVIIVALDGPQWERFYGVNATLPLSDAIMANKGYTHSILSILASPSYIWACYLTLLLSAICLTLGLLTRAASVIVYLVWISMFHRNPFWINGEDAVINMLLFFAMFAPLGFRYSIDSVLSREPRGIHVVRSAWSLRLIQLSVVMIYIFSLPAKYMDDIAWRDGSAIYYVSLSTRWFRFPEINIFHSLYLSVIATYATLAVELTFPLLVWFKRTRTFALISITVLHLGVAALLSSTVTFFNLAMLVSFITFVPSASTRLWVGKLKCLTSNLLATSKNYKRTNPKLPEIPEKLP